MYAVTQMPGSHNIVAKKNIGGEFGLQPKNFLPAGSLVSCAYMCYYICQPPRHTAHAQTSTCTKNLNNSPFSANINLLNLKLTFTAKYTKHPQS